MKKRSIVCLMVAALICSSVAVPANNIQEETITVSAAVYDEVPEGYTPIYTIDDLYGIRNDLSGNYILMNDIDLSATAPGGDWDSGNGWKPIGDTSSGEFKGTFDGNGYAIKNMHIYGTLDVNEKYVGLFGYCLNATLTRIALIDCDIDVTISSKMQGCDIGGICAYGGSISKSYATGTIKASISHYNGSSGYYIGGVMGGVFSSTIKDVFNLCDISVNETDSASSYCRHYIGGVGGESYNLYNTYNAGTITYTKDENSAGTYSIGNVIGYVNASNYFNTCYYLKTLSDYTASGNRIDSYYSDVAGLTVGQMKSQSAFNFDFDNIWTIDPTAEYPYPTLQEVPYVSSGSSSQPTTEPNQSETNPSSDSSLKGDINGDGKVDATDASIILVYAAMKGAGNDVSIDDLY
ncbi:MAG: hypothetical protein K2G25_04305 [Oscillospiraceae bacterium]|nr:hypothetical protein [Oscillospiraceae bacterium]